MLPIDSDPQSRKVVLPVTKGLILYKFTSKSNARIIKLRFSVFSLYTLLRGLCHITTLPWR